MIKLCAPYYEKFSFIMDVLHRAISYIPYKDICIYVTPIEMYDKIEDKNINIWNFEPILPVTHQKNVRRPEMMEKAIENKNVSNIFCFDLAQAKKYNIDKVKYLPLGYIEQMVSENNNDKAGKMFLGKISERRQRQFNNHKIDWFPRKSYTSLDDITKKISAYKYGFDTWENDDYVDLYVNCLRVSQYVMARTVVVSDNKAIRDFGVKSYIYAKDISGIEVPEDTGDMAERALRELKKNVNMRDIFIGYNI